MPPESLSLREARNIALTAQGFDRKRPRKPSADDLRRVIRRLGLLQIDYVNVLCPAQYQVPFSRLGPYAPALLDDIIYKDRHFTEQWAHEASILPVETWPLLRHRMERHGDRPHGFSAFMKKNADFVDGVLEEIRARGPLCADDITLPAGMNHRIPGTWLRTVPRAVLETFFGRGTLAVSERLPNFARKFDLAERLIHADHHGRVVARDEAQRELLLIAARALGVGTANDLADYFRMKMAEAKPRLDELVASGSLRPVQVETWRAPAYLHPDATSARRIEAACLLSPFDPLVWFRPRLLRLFDFDHRFEIFIPEAKRKWGVYVLPFLQGDRLVARVDLKSDRPRRRLRVLAAYLEPHAEPGAVAEALARELRLMAGWLEFDSVSVGRRGGFARALAAALRA